MAPRFLGLDLAWSDRNPSGVAVLDAAGRLVDLRADLRSDEAVLAWIRGALGDRGALAIDMPTIVTNASGRRDCEHRLAADFHRYHAGPYPANTGLASFREAGGRAARLLRALEADGVVHTSSVGACDARVVAFEAFPHPASIELFDLPRILPYKKKRGRSWPTILDAWGAYRSHLAALAVAEPPLLLDERLPSRATQRGYKALDDAIDAVLCAYVASFVWHHGAASPRVRVYGDDENGHIVIPLRRCG